MGEYYDWVNIDKKEYISPDDFDLGNKHYESVRAGNDLLGALYSLLADEWKGDLLIFLGDETQISEQDENPALQKYFEQYKHEMQAGQIFSYAYIDDYKNVSGLFKASEPRVREEIQTMIEYNDFDHNYYNVAPSNPFEGLFLRESKFFRYTVNHSKRVFFDIHKCRFTDTSGNRDIWIDPLPLLMAFGRTVAGGIEGLWLGDRIAASDALPPKTYKNVSKKLYSAVAEIWGYVEPDSRSCL